MKQNDFFTTVLGSRGEFITSFDKLFDKMMYETCPSFAKDFGVEFFSKSSFPKVDVIDKSTSIVILAEVPGFTKEDVEIKIEAGNVLSIKGDKKLETGNKEPETYLFKELKRSSFNRKFKLGENLDVKNINAKFVNGMLEITILKIVPKPQDDTITVTID